MCYMDHDTRYHGQQRPGETLTSLMLFFIIVMAYDQEVIHFFHGLLFYNMNTNYITGILHLLLFLAVCGNIVKMQRCCQYFSIICPVTANSTWLTILLLKTN